MGWLKKIAAAFLAMTAATGVHAQNSEWTYEATIYLFMPETKTGINGPTFSAEGTLSFSDALDNLDFAFMGAFGASNGRWSLLADYLYNDLSFGNSTPGPAFSGLNTALTTQILNGYVAYRVYEDAGVEVDVAGGFRWFSTKTAMTLTPGVLPGRSSTVDSSWVDPLIGARVRFDFAEDWSGTAFFDYGGFSSDSETWQVLFTVDYALNENWLLRGGYRYISVDHVLNNGNDFSFSQSGPVFGATYRF
ncbi:porin family protein [Seohaeicola saemankumensis]|nr:porin family protein [Seohaeicola saemankumensis]MCA0872520.1 porin family protein [Seohaeicola saemankumensis]